MKPGQDENELGQVVGFRVDGWNPPAWPVRETIVGRFCRLEPLDADRHGAALFEANAVDTEARNWTYLPYGPFETLALYRRWIEAVTAGNDPIFFAIVERSSDRPVGVASYLRIDPANGSIEVGGLNFSPLLQRKPAATEAMFLMMRRVFDEIGYRRYEWKCDSLNAASRAAAARLGFQYEGTFRQVVVYKGRNRDTAWFSIIDGEWPALRAAYEKWLAPENFTADGKQIRALSELMPRRR